MNWKALKENKCPSCGSVLRYYPSSGMHKCPTGDFMITNKKFEIVVTNLYRPKKDYVIQTDGILEESAFGREDLEINNSFLH